jgi:Methylene-tetrahydrofolate reductase C terminal
MLDAKGRMANQNGGADTRRVPEMRDLATLNKRPMTARERRVSHLLLFFEDVIKVPLFHCQRCGECILSSTAFICSQNCPKRMRNGPCGGTGKGGTCEVFPDRKCVWHRIHARSKVLHRMSALYRMNSIHNWNLEKTSSWLNVFRKRTKGPVLFLRNDQQQVKDLISHVAAGKD